MKNLSLQDQLLKAGLTNENKAKQVRAEKRKQTKQLNKNKIKVIDEAKIIAQEVKEKQQLKDKTLNEQLNKEAEKKQIANQIVQLIELNKISDDKDVQSNKPYNFTDQNKVKTLYISDEIRKQIIAGRLAIVRAKLTYEVIAVEVANKIKQRNEEIVVVLFSNNEDHQENDEYQGYEIPDDLMW